MAIRKFAVATAVTLGLVGLSTLAGFSEQLAACPTCDDILTTMPKSDSSYCQHQTGAACAIDKDKDFSTKQIYSYPNAIYGENNVVGSSENGVYIGDGNFTGNKGVLVTDSNQSQITGAAASLDSMKTINGVPVERMTPTTAIEIETATSMDVMQRSYQQVDSHKITGGAAAIPNFFDDVTSNLWASLDINKLAQNGIVVGYPDGYFKPGHRISRAEFASMIVNGYNYRSDEDPAQSTFKDVPKSHWANRAINEGVKTGLLKGYSDDLFKPNNTITRLEALTMLSKGITCDMDNKKADEVLSKYTDGSSVPDWAKIPVAKVLDAGAIANSPTPSNIMPDARASRAEVASMLEQMRIAMNLDAKDITQTSKTYIEKEEMIQVPTLQLTFNDQISSKSSNVGDIFTAKTIDEVKINGTMFPAGSIVSGKILEVVRPNKNAQGALKLSFNTIKSGDMKADLPAQILAAQVTNTHKPNAIARFVEWPFTWVGSMVGTASRTVGGAAIALGNAAEGMTNSFGLALGETAQGQFKAAGRSLFDSGRDLVKAPVDLTRTALMGTLGLFQTTADEVTYLVDPKGMKVSSINPKEKVTISFGCK